MSEILYRANQFIKDNAGSVDETYKPQYHFTPPIGWINDPNGFCYYNSQFHLFYQTYPYEPKPVKMYWGHAVSDDLINWKHLPLALAPDEIYDNCGVFSGTAFTGENLTLMYTGVSKDESGKIRQQQCIAMSKDGGVTFTKAAGNPVIDTGKLPDNCIEKDFRDPKVWKHGDYYYCLTVSVDTGGFGKLLLYRSHDLFSDWQYFSTPLSGKNMNLGDLWECPDLFELDGKDVLIVSVGGIKAQDKKFNHVNSVIYFIGKMDYQTGLFDVENYDNLDDGTDFYAPQTTEKDGKRYLIAWQNMWGRNMPTEQLGHGWAGSMCLPRELYIKEGRLVQHPVSLKESKKIQLSSQNDFTIKLSGINLSYDKKDGYLTLDRSTCGYRVFGNSDDITDFAYCYLGKNLNEINLDVFIDKCSLEIFAPEQGRTLTTTVFVKKISEG